ncbi:FAD-binding protein [uncultured Brevundimonas sp.]|uniref:FAD-binding protein n=1 Tax=uncultured Brevundimonas sp. TaxID=213418 RepID=UPI0025CCD00B|nr:FAD-binding protein [uncultured Brevundimonas sp.]
MWRGAREPASAVRSLSGRWRRNGAARNIRREVEIHDAQIDNLFAKDRQIQGLHNARRYLGDRLARVAKPHKLLDPKAGPLIAVKLHVLTRQSLGGIQTDLESRVLEADDSVMEGLFAAGEVAGFGGGGAHGYNALEGSLLGGCIFTGRAAGRAMA